MDGSNTIWSTGEKQENSDVGKGLNFIIFLHYNTSTFMKHSAKLWKNRAKCTLDY